MRARGCISLSFAGLAASARTSATVFVVACLLASARPAWAGGQRPDQSQVSSHESAPTFQLRVERNVVVVRVVVRDSKGRVVGNLRKDDFTLLDNGKRQVISEFSVEQVTPPAAPVQAAAEKAAKTAPPPKAASIPSTPAVPPAPTAPQRFVALFFDDLHLAIEDVGRSRSAADRYLASALGPQDRVAVFTSSGIGELEFTDDRAELHNTLFRLRPRSKFPEPGTCPEIGEYQAYLITQVHDAAATAIARVEAAACMGAPPAKNDVESLSGFWAPGDNPADQTGVAHSEAWRVWNASDLQSTYSLDKLAQVVRRLAAAPGQRNLVLVSSGFLATTHQPELETVIDHALRSAVVINALDARGLYAYVPREGNPSPHSTPGLPILDAKKSQIEREGLTAARGVMGTLAAATGGTFFTNSNDLDEGFRTVGALPEAYYVLTFSPQNLKADGKFHTLEVRVNSSEAPTVQARHGYLAPSPATDLTAKEKEEIREAVFSQNELHELPIEVNTQFFKISENAARLSILTHLDLRTVRFRKEQGRNLNTVKFVTVLFDRDGKYMNAKEKAIEFHLRDESLEELAQVGITARTDFDLKPGTYTVREVVRDAEGGQISGLTRTVEIPF